MNLAIETKANKYMNQREETCRDYPENMPQAKKEN